MTKRIEEFEKSGLANKSVLKNNNYLKLFYKLEKSQQNFLKKLSLINTHGYFIKWPKDTLHWWSRIWEYPYVFYHIQRFIKKTSENNIKILDFGSGVNFFPFAISELGHKVLCVDNDENCIKSLIELQNINTLRNYVQPKLNKGINIPFDDKSIDILYSVSVFEHVPNLELLIDEIYRVMKDTGILIFTFDVSLNRFHELNVDNYDQFINLLFKKFEPVYNYQPIHPNQILNSKNSPFPYKTNSLKKRTLNIFKNYIIRPLLFKKPRSSSKILLTVEGMVLKKKK